MSEEAATESQEGTEISEDALVDQVVAQIDSEEQQGAEDKAEEPDKETEAEGSKEPQAEENKEPGGQESLLDKSFQTLAKREKQLSEERKTFAEKEKQLQATIKKIEDDGRNNPEAILHMIGWTPERFIQKFAGQNPDRLLQVAGYTPEAYLQHVLGTEDAKALSPQTKPTDADPRLRELLDWKEQQEKANKEREERELREQQRKDNETWQNNYRSEMKKLIDEDERFALLRAPELRAVDAAWHTAVNLSNSGAGDDDLSAENVLLRVSAQMREQLKGLLANPAAAEIIRGIAGDSTQQSQKKPSKIKALTNKASSRASTPADLDPDDEESWIDAAVAAVGSD